MFIFDHHHPMTSYFYTTVLGFTVVLILSVWFFIHYLRVGLQSSDSTRIDAKK
ncbi:hypothetical protein P9B03_14445 [Metasolibacillus meyeri]|uniref:Uncharacterized protein n=1 Tax=Metasolibacillus meyeri TaxID=1071052 RepID=A0AAW9NX38_9BACL|nr:hypothetical protein [Metasolibacillus meyeri]MEC1179696.1 hypothetical protein [Metasolibacillus meyeri]